MPLSMMAEGRLRVFGDTEDKTVQQALRCLYAEPDAVASLGADNHFGYTAPIGLNIAYREHVAPAAVGYDIGCGNLAVATNVMVRDIRKDIPGIMDRIFAEVPFGMGRRTVKAVDAPVLDEIAQAEWAPQRAWAQDAAKQLGTVGGGNHYVDLFEDEATGRLWIGVHFGSRGFGHRTAEAFLHYAAAENPQNHPVGDRRREGSDMEAPPDLLHIDSGLGQSYLRAMRLAGKYAFAGRVAVVNQVLDIVGAEIFGFNLVHNHHNYAWEEMHDVGNGLEKFIVTRKGGTPAFPGQKGFVGASMGEPAVILEGVDSPDSVTGLYSTVHGAGRAMGRREAAGKQRKRWMCNNRDCDWIQGPGEQAPINFDAFKAAAAVDKALRSRGPGAFGECPKCHHIGMRKQWVHEKKGRIDWQATIEDLRMKGIELRGANAEEATLAYKRLPLVLSAHEGTIKILHTLVPIGVAMASGDVPADD